MSGFRNRRQERWGRGVLNEGGHSAHCEPNNTAADDAHVRRSIADRGVLGSGNPLRLFADAVGELGGGRCHISGAQSTPT